MGVRVDRFVKVQGTVCKASGRRDGLGLGVSVFFKVGKCFCSKSRSSGMQ